jgi:hypothetical protein
MTLERLEHDGGGLPTSVDQRADRQQFVMKNLTILKALVRLKYFSWEIEGAQHLPRQGPVVYAMNHAGWLALDTIMVGCSVAASVGVTRTDRRHAATLSKPPDTEWRRYAGHHRGIFAREPVSNGLPKPLSMLAPSY